MAHANVSLVEIEYKRFQDLEFDLLTQNEILKEKLSCLDVTNHSVEGGQLKTVWMMESWSNADSLRRMENRMRDGRDELVSLDKSIVMLYIKIISFQCSKVTSMLKKLDHIIAKGNHFSVDENVTQCPVDYTVLSYQEWSRTNPKLHALQSQVLELLNKKTKYRSKFIEEEKEEKLRTFTMNDFLASTTNNTAALIQGRLRSQTLFYLERDPLVDADFTLHVSKCVHVEANTFEAERMREFIAYCWDNIPNENGLGDNEYDDDLASMYQQFVGALVEHIMNKFGHIRRSGLSKSDLSRDQVFAVIESYLMPHIYDCIPKGHPDDHIICEQYKKLKNKAQHELGVQTDYIDASLCPYQDAVQMLREMSLVTLPTQKLRSIIMASQSVLKKMSELCSDEEVVAGADEFIDVWVYVTIQASVPDLCWGIQYLKDFSNSSYMLSETGYYLSSLEMSAEYIKRLDPDNLNIVECSTVDGLPGEVGMLLLPDCRAVDILCLGDKSARYFERMEREVLLKGYEMVTSLDMVRDSSRLVRVALKTSKDPNHVVKLQPIKLTECCTVATLSLYLRLNTFQDVILKKLDCGRMIPTPSHTNDENMITFIDMSDWSQLLNFSNLKWLDGHYETEDFKDVHEVRLANQSIGRTVLKEFGYQVDYDLEMSSVADCLKEIITEIQTYLTKMKLYSELLPKDGVCTKVLITFIRRFKETYYKNGLDGVGNDGTRLTNLKLLCKPQGTPSSTSSDSCCDYQTFSRLKMLATSSE